MNPVIKAIYQHDEPAIRKLIKDGVDLNFRERDGGTILMCAVREKVKEIVRLVLEAGVSVNDADAQGWTALHFAAQEGAVDIVNELVCHGAIVDAKDALGRTPLFIAVINSKGVGNMIRALMSHGANPNISNEKGISPKKLAESISNYNIMQFIK
jgi:ankyrin repeat protein